SAITVLAAAAGPVTIELGDDVRQGTSDDNQTVKYAAGKLTLEPAQVREFLDFAGYREPEANRVLRSQLVWEQLFAALPGDASVELDARTGFGEPSFASILKDLRRGDVRVDGLPLERLPLNNALRVVLYRVDQAAMPAWVPQVVPFPTTAFPGQRAEVRLLRGTADEGTLRAAAPKVVEGGGEVTTIGNAESFTVQQTEVRYADPDAEEIARKIARLLDGRVVESSEQIRDADVVVVVGAGSS
ncbi:MAG: LytR C-terminal domain-containing protein, partial [Actinomycetes bacterium]